MNAVIVLVAGLAGPGLLPAAAVARWSPATAFLAPLIGAAMAAVAAELELALAGSLVTWYLVVAVTVNVAVAAYLARWKVRSRAREGAPRAAAPAVAWSAAVTVLILAVLAVPLTALRAPAFGWDAEQIWLTHALMISGGHHAMLTGLTNPAYLTSNPDYPPLVSAAGAMAFAFYGQANLHIAVDMTVLLQACALGVVGAGLATVGRDRRLLTQVAAAVAGAAVCLAGFAIAGPYGTDGYADLLWAAAAAGAVSWGLMLPKSSQALGIACTCAAVASLTKNEGLATGVIALVLIAVRYRPVAWARLAALTGRDHPSVGWREAGRRWAERACLVVLPALPALAWAVLTRSLGIGDLFFKSSVFFVPPPRESIAERADVTFQGMAAHLAVAPVAAAMLLLGGLFLRRDRERAGLSNPGWLWTVWLGSLVVIFVIYLKGPLEIHGWINNSVNRTTIFGQLVLYAELAGWLVIAVDAAFSADRTAVAARIAGARQPARGPSG